MKRIKSILFYTLFCCATVSATAQYITVNDAYNAQSLVNILTNNSTCATTSNSSVSGDNTFSGTQNSYGSFDNQGGSFPFTTGIVLSTWSSINSIGPFIRDRGTLDLAWLGDSDLDQALGITSINATVLEFDFMPLTNFISFNYIFASNEYQDQFPCLYSDGFAFLIKKKGSTDSYKNLAVIPGTSGTSTPVSSTNIHQAINFTPTIGAPTSCPAKNETYFGQLNTSLTNSSPINYAGQTKILNAQTNVIAGAIYHIKLVIADDNSDGGLTYYDSAIFLEAGSFRSKIDLGMDRLLSTNNGICFGESYVINTNLPTTNSYRWYKDNSTTPIPGQSQPSYTATGPGTYKVELDVPNCVTSGEIKIEYTPETVLNNTTLVQCDDNGDGFSTFDLTKADTQIKNNNSSLPAVVYYETLSAAIGAINPIPNPTTYVNKSQNQILYGKVTNSYGCANYAELTLQISSVNIAPQNPFTTCDTDASQDGLSLFDLNSQVTPQVLTGLPVGLVVEYYLNSNDAVSQNNVLPNAYKNTTPNQQTIFARIVNSPDCYAITPITLIVATFNPPNFQDVNISLCDGNTTNISVAAGFSSYLWNTGATTSSITVTSAGNYSVKVRDATGCEATKNFYITASGIATITGAIVNDFSGNENSVVIEYTGAGDYEFSIDGSYFQDNPQFEGIAAGTYIAYARDKNGCGLSNPFVFYVLDYPRYFTPNGDGYNDYWNIENLNLLPKSTVTIFNRYGKLLKEISPTSLGWNGTFNGSKLPATDYWFNLTFEDGKIIKGHFSLKR
jgi:gliding motility-associated-like protein